MLGRTLIGSLVAGALASVSIAVAQPASRAASIGEQIVPPPPTYKAGGVTVEEHLGATLPLDVKLRTHDGTLTTLGDALHRADNLPTILTFNYADCPLLCSLQLNGLTASIPEVAKETESLSLRAGTHYRILTISLEPNESLAKLSKMREKYLERLPESQRAAAAAGWTFLAAATEGDGDSIRRIADVVGFKYTYIAERAEWAHPAAFMFLSTAGVITRYVYGFEIEPPVFRESIIKAGMAEPSTAVGFMHTCYFFDPSASDHSQAGVTALRIGAAGFVVLLLAGLGLLHIVRRHRPDTHRKVSPSSEEVP